MSSLVIDSREIQALDAFRNFDGRIHERIPDLTLTPREAPFARIYFGDSGLL
jgi:hypothetical protein